MAANPSSSSNRSNSPVGMWAASLVVCSRKANTINLANPAPLSSDNLYTIECIRDRVDYARQRLKSKSRFLTPNSQKLLKLYRNHCYDFLLGEELQETKWVSGERREAVSALRQFEHDISSRTFLQDVSAPELLKELVDFRKYVYWARYGDYASHLVAKLRKAAAEKPTIKFAEKLSGTYLWSQISRAIKDEHGVWDRQGSSDPSLVPATFAIYENCQRAGIGFDHMIYLINLYADRHLAFHSGLQDNLEKARYHTIAETIYQDLADLSSVCRSAMAPDEIAMRAILEQLRDEWFDYSFDADNPQAWNHKSAIREVHDQLQQKTAVNTANDEAIAKKAAARLGLDLENEELLIQAVIEHHGLPPEGPGPLSAMVKGKAKGKKGKEEYDVTDRVNAWKAIMLLQNRQYNSIQMTLTTQKQINRMVSAYRKSWRQRSSSPVSIAKS